MSRRIDDVIEFIRSRDGWSDTEKQVAINRLDNEPTQDELDQAHQQLYG